MCMVGKGIFDLAYLALRKLKKIPQRREFYAFVFITLKR